MRAKNKAVNNRLLLLTIIVNVLIPKAGIKIGEIPLTLGNVLLAVLLIESFIYMLNERLSVKKNELIILLGVFYFSFVLIMSCLFSDASITSTIPFFVTLSVYPLTYFAIKKFVTSREYVQEIFGVIYTCVLIVFAYMFIQFVFGIGNTAIPGVTVNYSDYILNPTGWWLQKSNAYGESSKFFSTYQNGNVFGLSILLLFPIIFRLPNTIFKNKAILLVLFLIACFLTGSRTVVLGCILYLLLLLHDFTKTGKISRSVLMMWIIFFSIGIAGVVYFISLDVNKALVLRLSQLLDWNVLIDGAGRISAMIQYFRWLFGDFNPAAVLFGAFGADYEGGAYEMTYMTVFITGGLIGLSLFLMPIISALRKGKKYLNKHDDWMVRGAREGILVYAVTAFVEGAYWLPPTAINLWTVMALMDILTNGSNEGD